MNSVLKVVLDNKEWLFSGVATTALAGIFAWILRTRRRNGAPPGTAAASSASHEFDVSAIACSALKASRMTERELIARLEDDLRRHPLLVEIESFESLPIPLTGGLVVIVSKLGSRYTIEDLRGRLDIPAAGGRRDGPRQ